jgi:ABC-type nitrate/sulfonate/bicarbonate transport system substrate-binding protein
VTLGYSNANVINWATVRMAYDPGYCAPYGVKVTPEVLNPTASTAAIENDEINFIATGAVVVALEKGTISNEKLVAYLGLNAPDEVAGIWAGPQITSPQDLIGKTLGASSPTSPVYLGALALLQHEGISPSQVHFTFISSNAAIQAALAHGTIAAAWNNGPMPAANTAAKDHIVIPLTDDPPLQALDGQFLTGNESFMKAHPGATQGLLACLAASTKAGRSSDPSVLSTYQTLLGQQMNNPTLAKEAWPEYPISAAVLPMNASSEAVLQHQLSLELSKTVPMSTIQGMVDATAMNGVTPVPAVNDSGDSQFPVYSGK